MVFFKGLAQDLRVLVEHRGVRFSEVLGGDQPVEFDAKRIRQVLYNLVSNALKVSSRGGLITLRSEIDRDVWRVSVEDEGPGVPAEQRERIFERFVRLESGGRQDDAGSGLGLAIARSIVGLHRGRIWAEEPVGGHGLRVVFEVPVQRPERAPNPRAGAETAEVPAASKAVNQSI
jgi:two-component system heavy metal sensor histidine kinase CusS